MTRRRRTSRALSQRQLKAINTALTFNTSALALGELFPPDDHDDKHAIRIQHEEDYSTATARISLGSASPQLHHLLRLRLQLLCIS